MLRVRVLVPFSPFFRGGFGSEARSGGEEEGGATQERSGRTQPHSSPLCCLPVLCLLLRLPVAGPTSIFREHCFSRFFFSLYRVIVSKSKEFLMRSS